MMFTPGDLCVLINFLNESTLREGPWGGEETHRPTKKEIFFVIEDNENLGPFSVRVLAQGGRIGWMSGWDLRGINE